MDHSELKPWCLAWANDYSVLNYKTTAPVAFEQLISFSYQARVEEWGNSCVSACSERERDREYVCVCVYEWQ